jgi:hypothetical protein
MFQKQEEWLAQHYQEWEEREKAEHKRILKKNPVDDSINLRVDFHVKLISQGHSIQDATKLSNEKYPEPKNRKIEHNDLS